MNDWGFVSPHGAVLAVIYHRGQVTAKQIADALGLTERPVRRIIAELLAAGYVRKERVGRANRYHVCGRRTLQLPLLRETRVGDFIRALKLSWPADLQTEDPGAQAR